MKNDITNLLIELINKRYEAKSCKSKNKLNEIEERIFYLKREIERWRIKLPLVSMRNFQVLTSLWIRHNYIVNSKNSIVASICPVCRNVMPTDFYGPQITKYMIITGKKPPICKCRQMQISGKNINGLSEKRI